MLCSYPYSLTLLVMKMSCLMGVLGSCCRHTSKPALPNVMKYVKGTSPDQMNAHIQNNHSYIDVQHHRKYRYPLLAST